MNEAYSGIASSAYINEIDYTRENSLINKSSMDGLFDDFKQIQQCYDTCPEKRLYCNTESSAVKRVQNHRFYLLMH